MTIIGLFFGSDTGNTEKAAKIIREQFGSNIVTVYDIAKADREQVEGYDILIFGCPTWYYGEVQSDWDDFLPTLADIDFSNKLVALFGCGDQEDYAEYFQDAMGILRDVIEPRGAIIVGNWPIIGYDFESSKALVSDDKFVGLALDEDRQPELTNQRIEQWVAQLREELNLSEILS